MTQPDYQLYFPLGVRLRSLFQRRKDDNLTSSERHHLAQEYARKMGYCPSKKSYQISAKMLVK